MCYHCVLQFVMEPSGPAFSLKLSHPITIGTIPFQNQFNQFIPATQQQTMVAPAPQAQMPSPMVHYNPGVSPYPPGAMAPPYPQPGFNPSAPPQMPMADNPPPYSPYPGPSAGGSVPSAPPSIGFPGLSAYPNMRKIIFTFLYSIFMHFFQWYSTTVLQ